MLTPSIFANDLFESMNDFFGVPEQPTGTRSSFTGRPLGLMKSDVKELNDAYEISVELPGFKKDEIRVELKEGYLTITAEKAVEADCGKECQEGAEGEEAAKAEKEEPKYIRKERYYGKMSRSFFVGKTLTVEDIHAKYENGVLTLDLPKEDKKREEASRVVSID